METTTGGRDDAGPPAPLSIRDRERFERAVLVHLDAAHNLARHLTRDDAEAEDAVQEAFLRALRYFEGFRGENGRAWLLRIVRNTCFTRLTRGRVKGQAVEFDEELHSPVEERPAPEVDLTRRLTAESVRRALDQLPPAFREVVVLRELEGLSYKEIAEVSGVPIGTVMSRLARARGHLQRLLAGGDA